MPTMPAPQRRAGAKGFGLFAAADLAAGQFLVEYVGEVLEEEEYLRRKGWYMATGQRHYYFMNVGNGEVIDACRKASGEWGGAGRRRWWLWYPRRSAPASGGAVGAGQTPLTPPP